MALQCRRPSGQLRAGNFSRDHPTRSSSARLSVRCGCASHTSRAQKLICAGYAPAYSSRRVQVHVDSPSPADANSVFLAGVDDSGRPEGLVRWDGTPIEAIHPFVGVAAVVVRRDHVDEFQGRWNALRAKIQRRLGTDDLPPIHLKWMWGKTQLSPTNPYRTADFRDIRVWLGEAINIIAGMSRYPNVIGVHVDFRRRDALAQRLAPYYTDEGFAEELAFFRNDVDAKKRNRYSVYHTVTTNPVLRILATLLWSLDKAVEAAGGEALDVVVDRFAGARGIDSEDVEAACRKLAQLQRVRSISEVADYGQSPLCQAADLVAYTMNRWLLIHHNIIQRDRQFEALAEQLIRRTHALTGDKVFEQVEPDAEAELSSLCVLYSLARQAVARRDPAFAETHMITDEMFHDRALSFDKANANGISVLKTSVTNDK
jgi:hypothetical protein